MYHPTRVDKVHLLSIILIGLAVFSLLQYFLALSEKKLLLSNLNQAKSRMVVAESQSIALKAKLAKEMKIQAEILQEKTEAEANFKAKLAQYSRMETIISQFRQAIAAQESENKELNAKIVKLSEDKVDLEAKLHTAEGLKKAVMDLRNEVLRVRETTKGKITEPGNAGYMTKEGKTTNPQNKTEAVPAP